MISNILLVFATDSESEALRRIPDLDIHNERYRWKNIGIDVCVTGVGSISTAWSMKRWLSSNPAPDLAINAGIAGTFTDKLTVGDVVVPVSDCFGDMGIETDGQFVTLSEAGMPGHYGFPFDNGLIKAENIFVHKALTVLPGVRAVTVNTVTGTALSVSRLKDKFNPEIETMEGATFFYICAVEKIPFLAIRSVSNKIEPGDRSSWDVPRALESLAVKLKEVLILLD